MEAASCTSHLHSTSISVAAVLQALRLLMKKLLMKRLESYLIRYICGNGTLVMQNILDDGFCITKYSCI